LDDWWPDPFEQHGEDGEVHTLIVSLLVPTCGE
jgi:hypothetical protein